MAYATFKDLSNLLAACHVFRGHGEAPFPPEVVRTPKGQWSLNLEKLPQGKAMRGHLAEISEQHGWHAKVTSKRPRGVEMPLTHAVVSAPRLMRRCDPSLLGWRPGSDGGSYDLHGGPHGPGSGDGLAYGMPPYDEVRYILGARDRDESARILDVLAECLTEGIEVVPLSLAGPQPPPFPFFWSVRLSGTPTRVHPSLLVLQSAGRTWWGPIGHGPCRLYAEWPYVPCVPAEWLNAMDWGMKSGLVLLSREKPQIQLLLSPPDAPPFRDLLLGAKLHVGEQEVLQMSADVADRPNLVFKVDLRLVAAPPHRATQTRLRDLAAEIRTRQALIEHLENEVAPSRALLDISPEPLFFYFADEAALPFPLRRLLIEWTDQREGLGELQYQRVDAAVLPPSAGAAPSSLHVLTTAHALGRPAWSNAGLRLRDYAPHEGRFVSFDLLSEWVPFGLRLFAPHGQHLALYPNLTPGPLAAGKLARALLPKQHLDPKDWCIILVPTGSGRIWAGRLAMSNFGPLTEAFDWRCAIAGQAADAAAIEDTSRAARRQLMESVGTAFAGAVEAEASRLLSTRREGLEESIRQHQKELQKREAAVAATRDMRPVNGPVDGARRNLTAAAKAFQALLTAVRQDMAGARVAGERVAELQRLEADLAKTAHALASAREALHALSEQVRRGRGGN